MNDVKKDHVNLMLCKYRDEILTECNLDRLTFIAEQIEKSEKWQKINKKGDKIYKKLQRLSSEDLFDIKEQEEKERFLKKLDKYNKEKTKIKKILLKHFNKIFYKKMFKRTKKLLETNESWNKKFEKTYMELNMSLDYKDNLKYINTLPATEKNFLDKKIKDKNCWGYMEIIKVVRENEKIIKDNQYEVANVIYLMFSNYYENNKNWNKLENGIVSSYLITPEFRKDGKNLIFVMNKINSAIRRHRESNYNFIVKDGLDEIELANLREQANKNQLLV